VVANIAVATQRLNAFIADRVLHPAYTYGSKTTAQACERMEEVLKVFEKSFDNTNNGK
jgi:ribosomal protein L31